MARVNRNPQNRTEEFRSILQQVNRSHGSKKLSQQRQSLLTPSEKANANGSPQSTIKQRSEFARQAANIGRGISGTMAKLERLALLAKRKTLFDDKPVEINELTYVIKQDLAKLDQDIRALQKLSIQPKQANKDQENEHAKNVVFLLRGKLGDVTTSFKDVLELRTRNIQSSRSRTENFISTVSANSQPTSRSDSPFYQTDQQKQGRNASPYQTTGQTQSDILSLDMPESSASSALSRTAPASSQQLMLMEEGATSNTYIQARGEAIETIEKTILGLWYTSNLATVVLTLNRTGRYFHTASTNGL